MRGRGRAGPGAMGGGGERRSEPLRGRAAAGLTAVASVRSVRAALICVLFFFFFFFFFFPYVLSLLPPSVCACVCV